MRWHAVLFALIPLSAACGSDDDGGGAKASGGSSGNGGKSGGGGSGGGGGTSTVGGGGGGNGGTSGAPNGGGGSAGSGALGGGGSGGGGGTGGGGSCLAGNFLSSIGKSKVLVGASMDDTVAKQAPFDVRYLYLSGGIPDGAGPCASCASSCVAGGQSCANSNPKGCAWWGCWQYDQDPPGGYVRGFVAKAKADNQIPMITYYMILQASKVSEGSAEVNQAANNAAFMARYYADWKFVLTQVGSELAFLHIEPDFWGYAEQVNGDPTQIPAAVASANATDCGSLPNTIAGMGQCLIAMTKKYAPNAKVSLHGSGWATKMDVLLNSNASFDVAGEAKKLGSFMAAAGPNADFITVDAADRDAAWYDTQGQDRWWDETNQTLPNFTQAFAWSKALGDAAQKPIFWWQLPVGNMSLPNQTDKWKDNRVDYFMTHMNEVAAAHGIGAAFGAGAGGQTTPSTDGGNLVSKVKAYSAAGGQTPCP